MDYTYIIKVIVSLNTHTEKQRSCFQSHGWYRVGTSVWLGFGTVADLEFGCNTFWPQAASPLQQSPPFLKAFDVGERHTGEVPHRVLHRRCVFVTSLCPPAGRRASAGDRAAREPAEPPELPLRHWLRERTGTTGQVPVPETWRAGEELQGRSLGGRLGRRGEWLPGPAPEGQVAHRQKRKSGGRGQSRGRNPKVLGAEQACPRETRPWGKLRGREGGRKGCRAHPAPAHPHRLRRDPRGYEASRALDRCAPRPRGPGPDGSCAEEHGAQASLPPAALTDPVHSESTSPSFPSSVRGVYMDYNATTPMEPAVIQAVTEAMREAWGNPSSPHPAGNCSRRAQMAGGGRGRPQKVYTTAGGRGFHLVLGRLALILGSFFPGSPACCVESC